MSSLIVLRSSAMRMLPGRLAPGEQPRRFRESSICDVTLTPPSKRPCFDKRNLIIERGNQSHARMIRSFLFAQYWPREPTVVGLWMSLNCPYLEVITDKYSHSGDRFLAFETIERTGEQKLIGVSVVNKVYPWMVDELEEWAHFTASKPERNRMYFCAHCLRSPNFFSKYNVSYIYDVEILGTAAEVTGQGVGTALLRAALAHAAELRHPLVQVLAVSHYTCKICERCGMKREWSMDFSEFIDDGGQRVFYPRRPHRSAAIYLKYFDPKLGGQLPCKPPFL